MFHLLAMQQLIVWRCGQAPDAASRLERALAFWWAATQLLKPIAQSGSSLTRRVQAEGQRSLVLLHRWVQRGLTAQTRLVLPTVDAKAPLQAELGQLEQNAPVLRSC